MPTQQTGWVTTDQHFLVHKPKLKTMNTYNGIFKINSLVPLTMTTTTVSQNIITIRVLWFLLRHR